MTAARTAPKGKGVDIIEIAMVTDGNINILLNKASLSRNPIIIETIFELARILREAPRVRNETVFKNEADLKPIAEVFRTLQAKSGTGGHAGLHLEGVNRIDIRQIGICMLINQTGINNTIKGDISSQG